MKKGLRKGLIAVLVGWTLPLTGALGGEARSGAGDAQIVIGMSAPWMEYGSFFWMWRQQAEKTAAELGVKVVLADAVWDASKQIADLNRFVALGVKGIVISPLNKDLGPAIETAVKAGIPVVTTDLRPATEAPLLHVAIDQAEAGRMAARFLLEKLGNKGTIVELVAPLGAATPIDQRREAFEQAIKGSKVELVVARQNGIGRWEGQQAMAKEFRQEENFAFDGVIAPNDGSLFGAIEAMSTFGADPAKKVVLGFDAVPEAYQYMREGRQSATVAGFADKEVDRALRELVSYIRTGKAPAQKVVLIKPELVTAGGPPAG